MIGLVIYGSVLFLDEDLIRLLGRWIVGELIVEPSKNKISIPSTYVLHFTGRDCHPWTKNIQGCNVVSHRLNPNIHLIR